MIWIRTPPPFPPEPDTFYARVALGCLLLPSSSKLLALAQVAIPHPAHSSTALLKFNEGATGGTGPLEVRSAVVGRSHQKISPKADLPYPSDLLSQSWVPPCLESSVKTHPQFPSSQREERLHRIQGSSLHCGGHPIIVQAPCDVILVGRAYFGKLARFSCAPVKSKAT